MDNKPIVLMDSSPMITLSNFKVKGRALIHFLLDVIQVIITPEVEAEVAGSHDKPNTQLVKSLIRKGQITIVEGPKTPLVLDYYPIQLTDCSVIRLGLTMPEAWTILDDRMAYLAAIRYGLWPMPRLMSTLDLLVWLTQHERLDAETAGTMVKSAASQFPVGFVAHTLAMLKEASHDRTSHS